MKSILLTSTALVAFAGAAAAEVSFGGEAKAEYNSNTGYSTSAELTATMTAELDYGLTATAEISVLADEGDDANEVTYGSITLASDNASLTFGTGLDGAVYSSVGDDYDIGQSANAARDDFEGQVDGIVGSYTMGETTLFVSAAINEGDTASSDLEFGIKSNLAGWDVAFGATDQGEYAATAAGTVAGADLNFGFASNDEWDAGVSYGIGAITLSASTNEADAWKVGADYDGGVYNAGFEYKADDSWKVTAGYAAGAIAVDASFNSADVLTLGATYEVGSGITVGAGLEGDDTYAFAAMDLGNGASAYLEYTDAAAELEEVGPSERDIAAGTTVGVSFTF